MKSRYRDKYLTTPEPLKDGDIKLRQVIEIGGKHYVILMIGVMWLPDIEKLEINHKRCVVAEMDGMGELKTGPMYNVLLCEG